MPAKPDPAWGQAPGEFAHEWANFSDALDHELPAKELDRNLIVASWNLREFGGVTRKWTTEQSDSPKRNVGDICLIAELISRFDVVAVQEVQANLTALRAIAYCLGSDWGFHVTDVTAGAAAGHERLAFVYDLRRVRPSGLVGELVLSPEDIDPGSAGHPTASGIDHQLVHTPYLMSFSTSGLPFSLATVHIVWGEDGALEARAREAAAVSEMLKRAAAPVSDDQSSDDFRASMILSATSTSRPPMIRPSRRSSTPGFIPMPRP